MSSPRVPSEIPYLEYGSCFFATIFIGFGFLWFVNAPLALSFFALPYPDPTKDAKESRVTIEFKKTLDVIAVVYGVRNIYLGAALYAAAICGSRQALGWITVAAGCVATVDGIACKFIVGKGQWNHWSYSPRVILLGATILGAFDWIPIDGVLGVLQHVKDTIASRL